MLIPSKRMTNGLSIVILVLMTAFGTGCSTTYHASTDLSPPTVVRTADDPAAAERDEIYTLLAYAVVLKDWQNNDMISNRGYNIGSVLVDNQKHQVVYWARNSVNKTHNMSQHGEVRLMTCYLASHGDAKQKDLKNFTIYTTLEPCAMCSGMMMLTSVPVTVYGQTDPGYGKALERLELDSRKPDGSGYPSYPRFVKSMPSDLQHRKQLDSLYDQYVKVNPNPHITEFLATNDAKNVFENALKVLQDYSVKYPENQAVLSQALDYYKAVPDHYVEQCSPQ
jgi:tRNA(Arg) A34 adenosine deaminase TadA